MHVGHSWLSGDSMDMYCKANRIVIHIRRKHKNLPIVYNTFVSTQEEKESGPHIRSAMAYYKFSTLDFFGDLHNLKNMISSKNGFENMINNEDEH